MSTSLLWAPAPTTYLSAYRLVLFTSLLQAPQGRGFNVYTFVPVWTQSGDWCVIDAWPVLVGWPGGHALCLASAHRMAVFSQGSSPTSGLAVREFESTWFLPEMKRVLQVPSYEETLHKIMYNVNCPPSLQCASWKMTSLR